MFPSNRPRKLVEVEGNITIFIGIFFTVYFFLRWVQLSLTLRYWTLIIISHFLACHEKTKYKLSTVGTAILSFCKIQLDQTCFCLFSGSVACMLSPPKERLAELHQCQGWILSPLYYDIHLKRYWLEIYLSSNIASKRWNSCDYLFLNLFDCFALWHMCLKIQKRLLWWHRGSDRIRPQKPVHLLKLQFHLHTAGSQLHESPGYVSAETKAYSIMNKYFCIISSVCLIVRYSGQY